MPHKQIEPEPPLVVHLTRTAGVLTLCGGVILLVAANAVIGVAIILLSALYFALAEIIAYLAVIARNSQAANPFFREEPEEAGREMDIA